MREICSGRLSENALFTKIFVIRKKNILGISTRCLFTPLNVYQVKCEAHFTMAQPI